MKMESRVAGIISEKDKESRITKCNSVFLEYAGSRDDSILGCTDYDLPWQEFADTYRQHELDVLAGNDYSIVFPAKIASGAYHLFLHSKAAKYNEHGEIVGLHCHAVEIINPDMRRLFSYLGNQSPEGFKIFSIGKNFAKHLTPREKDILFFTVKAKTAKQVARILNLSPRTVYSHLDNIKAKLNCRTKGELVDIAYQMGFSQELPQGIEKLIQTDQE